MELMWCPETAAKAYIDAVELFTSSSTDAAETEAAELIAAMVGGWRAQCVVEAWHGSASTSAPSSSSFFSPSLALLAAARRTGGRHVCVVTDEEARAEYERGMPLEGAGEPAVQVITGEAEAVMSKIEGVDFAVVDCRREDASRILRALRPLSRGAVVVCKEVGGRGLGSSLGGGGEWKGVFTPGLRVVRAATLRLGLKRVEVLHVGVGLGPTIWDADDHRQGCGRRGRWFKHVDRVTGEEHLFRL